MQNARDTFYMTMRDRLAVLNPARTIVVRGVTRPGLLVVENELASEVELVDTFCLHWSLLKTDARAVLPLVSAECVIHYATDGSSGSGGMDRGRLLAGMDGELLAAVSSAPQHAPKQNYTSDVAGGSPTAMLTNIWWSDVTFSPVVADGERLRRTATVTVMSYQEAGEL
ncbi:MAG: hypothetical protein KGK08_04600 [Acidobacteriota bacterium]|nr:hypothetical protein [Acidobacteriota bacterium]